MEESQRDKKLQLLKNQAKLLLGSFDSIQIFASKHEPENDVTSHYTWGEGNWFARYGQVREWLVLKEKNAGVTETE